MEPIKIEHPITIDQAMRRSGYSRGWINAKCRAKEFACRPKIEGATKTPWIIDRNTFDAFIAKHKANSPTHGPHRKLAQERTMTTRKPAAPAATTAAGWSIQNVGPGLVGLMAGGRLSGVFPDAHRGIAEKCAVLLNAMGGLFK